MNLSYSSCRIRVAVDDFSSLNGMKGFRRNCGQQIKAPTQRSSDFPQWPEVVERSVAVLNNMLKV